MNFERVMLTIPFGKVRVWLDERTGWWLRTPKGHLGHPDNEQLLGRVSIICPEDGCDEHFTVIPDGELEKVVTVGEQ